MLNYSAILKFIFIQFFSFALFFVASIVLLDKNLIYSPTPIFRYFFLEIKSTYIISAPIFITLNFIFILFYLVNKFKEDDGYGDADFANIYEINKMQETGFFEPKGTILGLKSGRFIRTNKPLSTLILAPQGTGKTAGIIIPSLLSDTSSYLINDVKGELWDITSKQRSKFGRVGIFAPSQNFKDGFSWNPLHKKCLPNELDDQFDYVDRIGAILYPTEGKDDTSGHFNAEAKAIFFYYAMKLIINNGGTSLPDIYNEALSSGQAQESIAADLEEADESENPYPPLLRSAAYGLLGKGGTEWQGSMTTFIQAMVPFSRPNIARNLRECDFSHKDFKGEKPFSLYLFIPANDIARMAPIVRMLVGYLVNEFLSMTDKKLIDAQRVVFCMDEFPRMGFMESLKDAPALQRGYNMATIFVAQDKNQLEKTYGQNTFEFFCTVTDSKVFFRQNETTTATKMSELIGKSTRKKKSLSSKQLAVFGSESISKEGVPLVLPQEIMSQSKNDILILASGHHDRPIKCKVAWWYKDKKMLSLAGAYNGLKISQLGLESLNELENIENVEEIHQTETIPESKSNNIVDFMSGEGNIDEFSNSIISTEEESPNNAEFKETDNTILNESNEDNSNSLGF